MRFKLGLVINPFAGIGGSVGLKGSDGKVIREKALAMGAKQLAKDKTQECFKSFADYFSQIEVFTASGDMGELLCLDLGVDHTVVYQVSQPSTAVDTKESIKLIQSIGVDLILFVGGDGTARNVFEVYKDGQAVLGVPAGVKIHSGVYAISPEAAGLLVADLINGKMLSLISADVVDIDEQAFRNDRLIAKRYGYLQIPASLQYVQAVKQGNQEVEQLVIDDIAAEIIESMEDDHYYVIGSGTTCAAIMDSLSLTNTLLGLDIVHQEKIVQADVTEKELLELLDSGAKTIFILTVIGGQGHILGRGNQQITPKVVSQAGWESFQIIATKSKLEGLNGKPLLVDTGNSLFDHELFGLKKVITGYRDYVLYPVGLPLTN